MIYVLCIAIIVVLTCYFFMAYHGSAIRQRYERSFCFSSFCEVTFLQHEWLNKRSCMYYWLLVVKLFNRSLNSKYWRRFSIPLSRVAKHIQYRSATDDGKHVYLLIFTFAIFSANYKPACVDFYNSHFGDCVHQISHLWAIAVLFKKPW